MKMKDKCLPCLVNQIIKVADITKAENRDVLFHAVFSFLSKVDFNKTNPEILGEVIAEDIGVPVTSLICMRGEENVFGKE